MSEEECKKCDETVDRAVKQGDIACIKYTGKLDSGEVFDTSEGREPLEFEAGSGKVIKGFDDAVKGMKKGDKKTVEILPSEGYGERDEKRIQQVPRSALPKEPEPKEGMMLAMKTPDGNMFPAAIHKIDGDIVHVDLNHPLAGKTLKFDLELVEIKEKKECNEKEEGCGDGCSCSGN